MRKSKKLGCNRAAMPEASSIYAKPLLRAKALLE